MKAITSPIPILFQIAAAAQLCIALLNLFLVRLLNWRQEVLRLPLLLREVFQVHVWFISITVAIFGVLSWRFAGELATHSNAVCRWLAAGIGFFWAIRTVLQVTYYSSTHWRGQLGRTIMHVGLLLGYGGLAGLYLWGAFARKPGGG